MSSTKASAAVNRFGLGAKPGEFKAASDPRDWLTVQLQRQPDLSAFRGLPSSGEILRREAAYRMQRRADKAGKAGTGATSTGDGSQGDGLQARKRGGRKTAIPTADTDMAMPSTRRELARDGIADIAARYRVASTTNQPFAERLVRFWSNHFAVSVDKGQARLYAAPMEREAIRPHALGNFADLLLAVETHPAMLRYLDNVASVGDNSMFVERAGRRAARRADGAPRRKLGLNENLAREILELHTLGVDGGYAQADVTELARAITGWGTPLPRELLSRAPSSDRKQAVGTDAAFVYRDMAHEPGTRAVLGRRYADDGEAQGRAILRDLALHPSTARHLSRKLASHFVSDAPPPALVERMARAYLKSGGELVALYRALIDGDEAWSADARKFKTPDDFVVSAMRAGTIALDREPRTLMQLLQGLGQPVFTPRSPAGFPDTASDWAAGDALRKRLQAATAFAERIDGMRTPLQVAQDALGMDAVGGDLAVALRRAGSAQEGYALLLASPAFQWRV